MNTTEHGSKHYSPAARFLGVLLMIVGFLLLFTVIVPYLGPSFAAAGLLVFVGGSALLCPWQRK